MATRIKHKRSAIPGKKPTVDQLDSGEIAINTADGKAFILKDDNTVQDLTKEIFENDTSISIDDATPSSEGVISAVVDGDEQLRVTASSIQAQNTVEIENANEVRFKELNASGQNYVGLKAPDNLSGNYTLNLPPTQGTTGQLLSTNGAGFLDWIDADVFNTSDERLKTNFKSIENPLEKIQKISGYEFDWQTEKCFSLGFEPSNKHEHGLKAQEIEKIVPDAVKIAPFDNDGHGKSKSGEKYLTVQYEKLVPLLIESIKAQQQQIDELRALVQKLADK